MRYWYVCLMCLVSVVFLIVMDIRQKYKIALVLKALSSLLFVVFGFLSYRDGGSASERFVLYGLCLGAVGDVLLNVRHLRRNAMAPFYIGGTFFFIGHLSYLIAFVPRTGKLWPAALIFGVVAAAVIVFFLLSFSHTGSFFKLATVAYITVVSVMASFAVTGMVAQGFRLFSILRAAGGLLFLASDTVLFVQITQKKDKQPLLTVLVLATYYPAQLLIAASFQYI